MGTVFAVAASTADEIEAENETVVRVEFWCNELTFQLWRCITVYVENALVVRDY